MFKLIAGFAIITCHLAAGSFVPASLDRSHSAVPIFLDRFHSAVPAAEIKLDSTSPGFSPVQMSELSDICFTALRIMLDQTATANSQREEETSTNTIPPGFQQIGSKFIYIETFEYMTLFEAENACQKMGGELATIEDEDDLNDISMNLQSGRYWIAQKGPVQWYRSDVEGMQEDQCVYLEHGTYMDRENCDNRNLFICEAEED